MPTALIAEDERLLASEIQEALVQLWPELEIVAVVHDGSAALRELQTRSPDVLFLDVQMPVLTGLEVARVAGAKCHVVFITAYDQYAVQAFEAGAIDYLLKPLDLARLAHAVQRVQSRLTRPPVELVQVIDDLQKRAATDLLQWITVLQGRDVQFIAIDDVCYFRADNKYVAVVTADRESLITTPLKELMARLDPNSFWQIHRGVVVNMHAVHSVRRTIAGHLDLKLKSRPELLRVSSAHAPLFKHM